MTGETKSEFKEITAVRHAATEWNKAGLFQGRTDIPLSPEGAAEARAWVWPLPLPELVVTSPLQRARSTASLLFPKISTETDDRLLELALGAWEGQPLTVGEGVTGSGREPGWRGLDFAPPGGESLLQVMDRLRPLLLDLAGRPEQRITLVTHKGVIHALYALATGWDGAAKPKPRPRFPRVHRFALSPGGKISLLELNLPLA
jgi:probable phosphoglycerate mutase